MKPFVFLLLFVLALTGAACDRMGAAPSQDVTVSTNAPSSQRSDRDDYISNLDAKIEDLLAHIDALQEKRDEISADLQATFDQQMTELRREFDGLKQELQALKDAPESMFMELRSNVNAQLAKVEDLYLQIITDFELEVIVDPA